MKEPVSSGEDEAGSMGESNQLKESWSQHIWRCSLVFKNQSVPTYFFGTLTGWLSPPPFRAIF